MKDPSFLARLGEAELPPLELGRGIELRAWVGEGGMGVVYEAWDTRLERPVAVKVLSPRLADAPEELDRLEREARALAQVRHRGAVEVYDFITTEDGVAAIVMAWVDGSPLDPESCPDVETGLHWVRDAADAVAAVHDRGWVHRDLKPDNVLLDRQGEVKVTDFGIAIGLDGQNRHTREGAVVGTPAFMAPEILEGHAPHPGMDVYGLGMILRRCLDQHAVPEGVREVVDRACAPRPTERYPHAGALRSALDRLLRERAFDPLPDEYRSYLAAVALLFTLASACVFWAGYLAFQPAALLPEQLEPLLMGQGTPLPDGRVVVRARFPIGPTLLAGLAAAVALTALGGLQYAWRRLNLRRSQPNLPLTGSRRVLWLGAGQLGAYVGLRAVLPTSSALFGVVSVFGGLVEATTLFFFWQTLIELRRVRRPVRRELSLWLGLALALVPPTHRALTHWASWSPSGIDAAAATAPHGCGKQVDEDERVAPQRSLG